MARRAAGLPLYRTVDVDDDAGLEMEDASALRGRYRSPLWPYDDDDGAAAAANAATSCAESPPPSPTKQS